jgi:alpha-tubulin suppressor-like RCC1 family protein
MPNLTFAVPRKMNFVSVTQVVSQQYFALARQSNGKNWGWGRNLYGEVGNNTITSYCSPVSVAGASKTFCEINAGDTHAIALDKYGQVWGWGEGTYGQIGNNSTLSRRTPVSITGAKKTFCSISAGVFHSAGLDRYGKGWAWGRNLWGELGDKTIVSKNTPVSVSGAFTFCKITAGNSATMALDLRGRAWAWGFVGNGQTGTGGGLGNCRCSPIAIAGALKTFCYITLGQNYGMAIDLRGRAWGWGTNDGGRIGDNTTSTRLTPVSVLGAVKTFCEISIAQSTTLGLDKNGQLWAWGTGTNGQLGNNNVVTNFSTPISVSGTKKTFCKIGGGVTASYAVDRYGKLWSWGYQFYGELGNNFPITWSPISVTAARTFSKIAIGTDHGISIDRNGRVFGWGRNQYGEIGDNTLVSKRSPVSILGANKTFCKISSGFGYNLAIDKNGRVWGWGFNNNGQVGNNSTVSVGTPVSILGSIKTFCEIATGDSHSLGITNGGRAWSWGFNIYGALGDNSVVSKRTPVSILGAVKTFCKISAGQYHSASIDKNGRGWTWGYNNFGQLGDNSVTSRLTPVSILGAVKTFCHISASQFHTMAIDLRGRAWGWGLGSNGRIGDNTITSRRTPVSVAGAVKTFCKIAAGFDYSLGIDKNGRIWSWGGNGNGQLGIGDYASKNTPVSIFNTATKTFCEVFTGYNGANFSTAIDKNGRIWSWGRDFYGVLGINSVNTWTPISIPYL